MAQIQSISTSKVAEAIYRLHPNAHLSDTLIYNKVLLKGVVYVTSSYKQSVSTDDSIVFLEDNSVELARMFISFCSTECNGMCLKKCHHIVIVELYEIACRKKKQICTDCQGRFAAKVYDFTCV